MYNNIKNFINPRYATLFLFCIVSLLVIIFMKSRAESFVGNDLKDVKEIRSNIRDLKDDVKINTKDIKSGTSTITSLEDKKLNISDFDATLDKNAKFKGKLNASDFDATLDKNAKFNGKLNTSDFESTLAKSDQLKAKLNTSDFSSTLSKDPAIMKLQTDLRGVPTSDNIGNAVNQQVQAKVGDINAANTLLTTNFNDYTKTLNSRAVEVNKLYDDRQKIFDEGYNRNITEINNITENKINNYKTTATQMKNDFLQTANTQLDLLNSNYQTKVVELGSLKAGAEFARDGAVLAKQAAEDAKFKTEKMYKDVFGKASAVVIDQANNSYKKGREKDPVTGYYKEEFGTIYEALESPVPQAVFDKEKEVIQDINAVNQTYYNLVSSPSTTNSIAFTKACYKLAGISSLQERNLIIALNAALFNDQAQKTAIITALEDPTTGLKIADGSITELLEMYKNLPAYKDQTDDIIKKASAIDELRRDLDTKMNTILQSKNRIDEPSVTYDSTVYAGILWSILGTSLLFYVFTE